MTDLLTSIDVEQSVTTPNWLIDRPGENRRESTGETRALASDHCCVLSRLRLTVPLLPPAIVEARNIRSIDRQTFKVDLHDRLSAPNLSAAEVDQSLRTVLDQHAPATHREVPARRSSPCLHAVADDLRAAKRERQRAERRWRATGLSVHTDLYNTAKRLVIKPVLRAKVVYFSTKIVQYSSSKQLFNATNQLADRKKPQVFPNCYPLVELPQRFADFFLDKIRATRLNVDSQIPEPCSTEPIQAKQVPFSFSCSPFVTETEMKTFILK